MTQAPPRTTALLATAAAALAAFTALAFRVLQEGPATAWDRSLFRALYVGETTGPPGGSPNDSRLLDLAMPVLNRTAQGPALAALLCLALAVAALRGGRRRAAFLAAAVSITLLAEPLKSAFGRHAPFESHGGVSFPSGHAIGSMALALAIAALLAPTRWRWVAVAGGALFTCAVAVTVIADGGHWPTDVLGGWLLAIAWVSLLAAGFRVRTARSSA